MQYKPLGTSNLNVSVVGFGCMSLTGSDQENSALLKEAVQKGINYFDTADIYQHGENETTVGKALAGVRQQIILATKAGNVWKADGSGLDWNPSKAHILQAAEQSLKRLNTDYIDLYQLHGGTINDNIDDTLEAFELLKAQGKIRHYGISSIRPNVIREYCQRSAIVSVMMQYSLLDRRPEEACLALLQQHNISVVVRGSVASGLLAGKPAKSYLDYTETHVKVMADALQAIAKSKHVPSSEVAIQYVLANPAVASAVVGIRTPAQLNEALQAAAATPLAATELIALQQALHPNTYRDHR
ncbi:aldo/keto reductase [Chryseolinea lacunae]|uniref:Aldo/keto reductase n=1 Tax=Chryseolinea lacunae TaxID=2801331 RepID=A0ABS1KZ25_9BACT|nr:aldo/keto reductase [Chryseolinea lacunae]MBL0743932.1 aldo/keto reductase [Chryseolinea lacunae]